MSKHYTKAGIQKKYKYHILAGSTINQIRNDSRCNCLKRVSQIGNHSCFLSQHTHGIRCSCISAAKLSYIYMFHFSIQITGLEQPTGISDYQTNDSFHNYHPPHTKLFCVFFCSFPNDKVQRSSSESKCISDTVLNVSGIGEMHQLLIIYKYYKCRWFYRYLRNVI